MIETPHARHPRFDVPIYSLYSETHEPTAAMLDGLDLFVIDLQDVGTRVYTYIYTMANCLRAAARHGVRVIVCDRPNPIGGEVIEGPVLDAGYTSFIGQFPIPLRHGMTIGELARLFNNQYSIGADLEVFAVEGWSRASYHDDWKCPWVMPSPNLPTLDSAIVYPGCVLLEGTTLSEGRGTTRPFELIGAPGVDANGVAARLNTLALPGVHFRPVTFEPTFQKHARQPCSGCQLHVTDRRSFRPVLATVAVCLLPAGWTRRRIHSITTTTVAAVLLITGIESTSRLVRIGFVTPTSAWLTDTLPTTVIGAFADALVSSGLLLIVLLGLRALRRSLGRMLLPAPLST